MKVDLATVRAAMEQHRRRYAERERAAWDTGYHSQLWETAAIAVQNNSFEHFEKIYDQLRTRWQVFRGGDGSHWSARQIFDSLADCDPAYSRRNLSELTPEDSVGLWGVLDHMKDCDLPSYLAILLWAGSVMRESPAILAGFREYISPALTESATGIGVLDYEAVAFEWLLLGVVELPPPGITFANPQGQLKVQPLE